MRSRLRKVLAIVVPLLIFVFLARIFWEEGKSLDFARISQKPHLAFFAFLFSFFNSISCFFIWYWIVNDGRRVVGFREGYFLYNMSSLAKYLPAGKVWQFTTFFQYASDKLLSVRSSTALLGSALMGLATAMLIATVCGPIYLSHRNAGIIAIATLVGWPIALYLGQPLLRWGVSRYVAPRFPGADLAIPRIRALLLAGVIHLAAWVCEGIVSWCLVAMVKPIDFNWNNLGFLVLASSLGYLGGHAAFFSPHGLGVREGIMFFLLRNRFGVTETLFLTLALRLITVTTDVLCALPIFAKARRFFYQT